MTRMPEDLPTNRLGEVSAAIGRRLTRWTELICAGILAILVLDVGIGIFGRYVIDLPVTWTEELARYLMIWAALLAISCGISRREHVAVTALLGKLSKDKQRLVCAAIDTLAFSFFAFLCFFGIDMARQGANQYATIFEMTMAIPFAAVPVASALACIQLLLTGIRDFTLGGDPTMLAKEAK